MSYVSITDLSVHLVISGDVLMEKSYIEITGVSFTQWPNVIRVIMRVQNGCTDKMSLLAVSTFYDEDGSSVLY